MPPKILVVSPSAEVGEIAREMAPKGFETVVVNDMPRSSPIAARHRIHDLLSARADEAMRSTRRCRSSGSCSCSRAGYDNVDLEAARRAKVPLSNNGGANAISVSEHALMLMLTVYAQGGLAARQRVGRALARQRAGAAHVRAVRQDARHRRARHHRQEGGAARRARSACGCSISTSRASPRTRPTRSACASACCANCCAPPTSCRCTCR